MSPAGGAMSAWLWMLAAIFTTVTTARQVLVVRGTIEASWPLIDATTTAGKILAIAFHSSFVVFCLVGLILSL